MLRSLVLFNSQVVTPAAKLATILQNRGRCVKPASKNIIHWYFDECTDLCYKAFGDA